MFVFGLKDKLRRLFNLTSTSIGKIEGPHHEDDVMDVELPSDLPNDMLMESNGTELRLTEPRSKVQNVQTSTPKYRQRTSRKVTSFSTSFPKVSHSSEGFSVFSRRSCFIYYLQSLVLKCAVIKDLTLLRREEHRCRMEHLEDLFSDMLLREGPFTQHACPILNSFEPDGYDHQFLHHKVGKLICALERRKGSPISDVSTDSDWTNDWPSQEIFSDEPSTFGATLTQVCLVIQQLHPTSIVGPPMRLIEILNRVARALSCFGFLAEAAPLRTLVVDMTTSVYHRQKCIQHRRVLALALYLAVKVYAALGDPTALSIGHQATELWQDLYQQQGDVRDLAFLIRSLYLYEAALFRHRHFEESLSISQQALLLMRTLPESYDSDALIITWSASGEADLVFTSQRQISRSALWAVSEGYCLWNVAKGLAVFGRYGEAKIVAMDAIRCYQALVSEYPEARLSNELWHWQTDSLSWISIPKALSLTESFTFAPFVEEVECDPTSSTSPSLNAIDLRRALSQTYLIHFPATHRSYRRRRNRLELHSLGSA